MSLIRKIQLRKFALYPRLCHKILAYFQIDFSPCPLSFCRDSFRLFCCGISYVSLKLVVLATPLTPPPFCIPFFFASLFDYARDVHSHDHREGRKTYFFFFSFLFLSFIVITLVMYSSETIFLAQFSIVVCPLSSRYGRGVYLFAYYRWRMCVCVYVRTLEHICIRFSDGNNCYFLLC